MNIKNRILIISTQGIGDLVMLMPCLSILEMCNIPYDVLVKDASSKDFIKEFNFNSLHKVKIFKRYFSKELYFKYDLIIPQCTISKYKFIIFCLLHFKFKNAIIGYRIINIIKKTNEHNTIQNFNIFKSFLPNYFIINIDEFKRANFIKKNTKFVSNTILIAPGGGWRESHKHLSPQLVAKLVNVLNSSLNSINFVIIGGDDNMILSQNILFEIKKINKSIEIVSLVGKTDFCKLFDLINGSKLLISACNGISHIAGILGANIYGFYGPTNPLITGPFSSKFNYSSTSVACGPCYSESYPYGCINPNCMENFNIEIAANDILKIINNN